MITTSGSLQKPRSLQENTIEISSPCNNPLSGSGSRRRTSYSQLLLSPSLGPLSFSLWFISSGSSCYLDTPFSEKSKKPRNTLLAFVQNPAAWNCLTLPVLAPHSCSSLHLNASVQAFLPTEERQF